MFQKIKQSFLRALPVAIISLLLVTAIIYAQFQEPGAPPPQGNVPPPINIGSSTQYKSGALGIGGVFTADSRAVFNEKVGIGTTNPGAALEIVGQIKITGGSPGIGKVLTSDDASGLASWQTFTGALPQGNLDETLRHNGRSWIANDFLRISNNGSVGIGTAPVSEYALTVIGRAQVSDRIDVARINLNGDVRNNWRDFMFYICNNQDWDNGAGTCFNKQGVYKTTAFPLGVTCDDPLGCDSAVRSRAIYLNPPDCFSGYSLSQSHRTGGTGTSVCKKSPIIN